MVTSLLCGVELRMCGVPLVPDYRFGRGQVSLLLMAAKGELTAFFVDRGKAWELAGLLHFCPHLVIFSVVSTID
jgi:hypothetical protein